MPDIRTEVVPTVITVAAIGITLKVVHNIRRKSNEKLAEIRRNSALDIQAIDRASAIINERILHGDCYGFDLNAMIDGFHTEIEFQKIAIRN